MVAVISVDTDSFLTFSNLTCHRENTGIGAFWLQCASSDQVLIHQQVKIPGSI